MSGSRILIASDLDRTLIYSAAALAMTAGEGPPLICVERYLGKDSSFMTHRAGEVLRELAGAVTLVPVTTRTQEQLLRVDLPGAPHRYAIAANGGVLLVDGTVDASWDRRVQWRLADAVPLDEVWRHVSGCGDPSWMMKLRTAADLFCYAVVDRQRMPADFLARTTAWAADRGWVTSLQGRKLYWLPKGLTKSEAVREVAQRMDASLVLAAGDSLLDADLLECADLGVHPPHGELADAGWSAPHVTRVAGTGVLAGEHIVEWFASTVRAAAGRADGFARTAVTPAGR
jgi:hypothetical protein